MLNKNYGRASGNAGIEYAPRAFHESDSLVVPRIDDDEAYASRGWYRVINVRPSYDAVAKTCFITRWTVDENTKTITAEYTVQDRPADTRKKAKKYSKLRMTLFCMEQNIWTDVKEFLKKVGYYDLFVMAQYFLDTDDYFQKGISAFLAAYEDENHPKEELEALVDTMLNFAFDGYEILGEDEGEVEETSTASNAGV